MSDEFDQEAARDNASRAALATWIRTYAAEKGVAVFIEENPTLSSLQQAARACELKVLVQVEPREMPS